MRRKKRERETERQHTVKRSSDRLGSHSSSLSPGSEGDWWDMGS